MISRFIRKIHMYLMRFRIASISNGLDKPIAMAFQKNAIAQCKVTLEPFYKQYIDSVSRPDMAVSLELAAVLYSICETLKPTKLLDLGSGFSSFLFQHYAKNNSSVRVWSIDDDINWIEKTRNYLKHHHLKSDSLFMIEDFIQTKEGSFSLVFLDLNFVEVRRNYIKLAVDSCRSGGLIVFDDVHKPEFMYEILKQTSDRPIKLYDLKSHVLDNYNRYALLGIKNI